MTNSTHQNEGVKNLEEFNFFNKLIFIGFVFVILSNLLDGPFRYLLNLVGFPSLIYIRDLVVFSTVAIISFEEIIFAQRINVQVFITFILFAHLIVGLLNGMPTFQGVIGLKIYFSVVYGVTLFSILRKRENTFFNFLIFSFFLTCVGVIVNKLYGQFPWEGLSYDTVFGSVNSTRVWWSSGEVRLSGFTRSSFDAAIIIAITAIAVLLKFESFLVKTIIVLIAFLSIYLTTTKGVMQVFIFVSFVSLIVKDKYRSYFCKSIATFFLILMILMPLLILTIDFFSTDLKSIPRFFFSLWERFTWMWPDAFKMLKHWYQHLFGMGIGSIGVPQKLMQQEYNAADNLFIYFYVNFGLIAFFYLFLLHFLILRVTPSSLMSKFILFYFMILWGYGITTACIENAFSGIILGVSIGYLFNHVYLNNQNVPKT